MRATHGLGLLLAIGLIPVLAHAQLRATLSTSDVAVDLKAGAEAPQLLGLRPASGPRWVNTGSERLPTSIERGRERIPLAMAADAAALFRAVRQGHVCL